ncbi:MAG: DNA polymerase I [Alphaproteobacteria bacterium]|nr:DNA polymerase I [Alphaproteobacteria bacterium]MCB9695967.1 DNA polymerase I [Alphaproteobacteria bacterium]
MSRVVLVDGLGLLYRAWHAIPGNLKTTAGQPTNALYGFAQMFRKVFAGRRPAFGAVVMDAPGGSAGRKAELPGYKAHRPPMPDGLRDQLPFVDELVAAHGFPLLRVPDVEADDVIATLTATALAEGHDVWVVSGDKDLLQLVGDDVRVLEPTSEILMDAGTVKRKLGVPPERVPDWLALCGDASDGIPGVPGIGERTATSLLERYGTLEEVLACADAVGGKTGRSLREHAARTRIAKGVATLRRDVPLPVALDGLALPELDLAALDAVYLKLEFFSLLSPAAAGQVPKRQSLRYYVCDEPDMARAALHAECLGPEPVALHVLYEEPDHLRGELVGIALSPALGTGFWFPFAGPGKTLGPAGLELLRHWLEDPAIPKVAHEHKRAIVALARHGVTLAGVVGDPALASYLVDMTKHLPHRLEQVAREYLHVGLQPLRGLVGTGKARKRFVDLTVDKAGAYACHLADATGASVRALEPHLEGPLLALYRELDLPLSAVLARMELAGIAVDPEPLRRMEGRLLDERTELDDAIAAAAGRPFNPGSHRQLGQVLFEELGLPVRRRTKTGYAVDAEVLEDLADQHEVIDLVLRWRTVDKLIAAYTRVLLAAIGPDGRIHPTFQQLVGSAGRLITTEPDLQRTPVRTDELREVREAFVARPGARLISADWGQIELRVLAHVTGDAALTEAFREGRDVHRATAATLFGVTEEEVDRSQREIGKTVNFATIYGQGPSALARQLQIPTALARSYIATFFAQYQGVAAWREQVVQDALRDTYVTTLTGRRRTIPELFSNDPDDRAYGERVAVNTPIQASAADLCKRAMLAVDGTLRREGLDARMVLQIHDELLIEAEEGHVERASAVVREEMEHAWELAVPLVVDLGVGRTWGEAH